LAQGTIRETGTRANENTPKHKCSCKATLIGREAILAGRDPDFWGACMISIVDDDPSARESLRDLLESLGYAVSTFESAERFLESGRLAETSCLISDVHMPGLSGLDLQSQLAADGHHIPVIFITGFPEERFRIRARSAGAIGFLSKPFDEGALISCLETALQHTSAIGHTLRKAARATRAYASAMLTKRASDSSVHFASGIVRDHCHICAFFNGADDEYKVLRSFIKHGLDAGEKGFHIVDPDLRADHLNRLAQADINVEQAIATGQLEVRAWQEAYLRGDRFDQDAMLALLDNVLQSNAAAGYSRTRMVAHMEWALLDKPGVGDLLEYESRANYVLAKYHNPVICTYDLSKFSASVAIDVMRTHPMVIIGGVLQKNPFFVPPDQFLLELRERELDAKSNTGVNRRP
jgi:FixJ family two-component response regulator